jgi:hypothetical protein
MTMLALATTTTRPTRPCLASWRLPSRNAAARPARFAAASQATRVSSTKEIAAATIQTAQQRQHDQRARGHGEPERGGRAVGLVPEENLERALDCYEDDERIEEVPPRQCPQPRHGVNVLQARAGRLLPG